MRKSVCGLFLTDTEHFTNVLKELEEKSMESYSDEDEHSPK